LQIFSFFGVSGWALRTLSGIRLPAIGHPPPILSRTCKPPPPPSSRPWKTSLRF
jgi:hypothetical protein